MVSMRRGVVGPRLLPLAAVASLVLVLSCNDDSDIIAPTTGALVVTTVTTGDAPAGYTLTLDGDLPQAIGPNATVSYADVVPGPHAVALTGLPAGCAVAGENPRTVTIEAGATGTETFAVTCTAPNPTAGSIRIVTSTAGTPDPDGYDVTVDDGAPQPIGTAAAITVANVAPGIHTVTLAGLAPGCTVGGSNPQSVTVAEGATAEVGFAVTCAGPNPTTGSIHIVTTSAGTPDLDGYLVALDGGAPLPVAAAGEVTLPNIQPGAHTLTLSGLAPGCTVSGDNPLSVTVSAGATAEVTFAVTCAPPTVGRWTPMESGTTFSLLSVWGSSATDVFATGEPGGAFTSTIFHYDGQAWSQQSVQDGVTLYGLWGSSAADVYAVGSDGLGRFEYQGAIFHYDGITWTGIPPTGIGLGEVVLYSVWGSSPTDVYVVGEDFIGAPTALVAHFDGNGWSRVQLPEMLTRILFDVHGTSGQDVWAVGYHDLEFFLRTSAAPPSLRMRGAVRQVQEVQGIILHYNGTDWTEFGTPEQDLLFNGVWSAAPNDVFAVGQRGLRAAAYHFDGTAWTRMEVPPVGQLYDVWGTSGTDVYAVGNRTILHYDGSAWSEVQTTVPQLGGVWGSSAADVFAVGVRGTIMHGTP
jgi:hypothetical protein